MSETDLAKAFDTDQPADARLATALQGTLELIRKAQERLCTHLRPDGPDDDRECLSELLEMFDGPRQRAIETASRSALAVTREQAEHATEYVLAQINAELKAENTALAARVAELEGALKGLVARFAVFTGRDRGGWGNQENAYYDLAKHAQKEWEAAHAALQQGENDG